jgi:DNA-binding MarR family transcriptional regulator
MGVVKAPMCTLVRPGNPELPRCPQSSLSVTINNAKQSPTCLLPPLSSPRCRRSAWGRQDQWALDTDRPWLYHSYMNDMIAVALIHAAHRVEARLEKALAGVGLSGAKFGALSVLVSQDRPMSLSELAEKLTCVRSNVTQLVDRLEADGLVNRTDDPVDRRAVRAQVTALGRERHAAGAVVVNAVFQDVAQQLSAVDAQVLKRALDAVQ